MRAYNLGSFYRVTYTAADAEAFASRWPCSTVHGRGAFEYDADGGDLRDATGTAATNDGNDWLAFSQDCQEYGKRKLNLA